MIEIFKKNIEEHDTFLINKEFRPVFFEELELFGFNEFFNYEYSHLPFLWSEHNSYYYNGERIAYITGGNIFDKPTLHTTSKDRINLYPINITDLLDINKEYLNNLEDKAIKRIKQCYNEINDVDIVYSAYSGGKDSTVLLELVKKSLNKDQFLVLFSDTGMEFSDTYKNIQITKEELDRLGVKFFQTKSHIDPSVSWNMIGPPSRTLRWCHVIHKVAPQIITLKELTKKHNYKELVFVGCRRSESKKRSQYEFKQNDINREGSILFYPILDWTSQDVWMYMFLRNLNINNAYKKGLSRVGCICCPLGDNKNSWIEMNLYPKEKQKFIDIIIKNKDRDFSSTQDYLTKGGWKARKNGVYLKDNSNYYNDLSNNDFFEIEFIQKSKWKEWVKTIGDIDYQNNIPFLDDLYKIDESNKNDKTIVKTSIKHNKKNRIFINKLRKVIKKSASCIDCGLCRSICPNNCISFDDKNNVKISGCNHCGMCLKDDCIVFTSIKKPKRTYI